MNKKTLKDLYSFPGFRASAVIKPHLDHCGAQVVKLTRRQKKRFVLVAMFSTIGMTAEEEQFAIWTVAMRQFIWNLKSVASNASGVRP